MTEQQKRLAMVLGLLGTLALVWFAPATEGSDSEPAKTGPKNASAQVAAAVSANASASRKPAGAASAATLRDGAVPEVPNERASIDTAKGLFGRSTWYVEPPPPKYVAPPPPPPPPPPQAPPLPYTFLGKYIEDGVTQVILTKGNRVITAMVGDVVDREYRVERIDASAIVLMYLPLQQTQSVPTGSSQ